MLAGSNYRQEVALDLLIGNRIFRKKRQEKIRMLSEN
jgi:hypothetical protein